MYTIRLTRNWKEKLWTSYVKKIDGRVKKYKTIHDIAREFSKKNNCDWCNIYLSNIYWDFSKKDEVLWSFVF